MSPPSFLIRLSLPFLMSEVEMTNVDKLHCIRNWNTQEMLSCISLLAQNFQVGEGGLQNLSLQDNHSFDLSTSKALPFNGKLHVRRTIVGATFVPFVRVCAISCLGGRRWPWTREECSAGCLHITDHASLLMGGLQSDSIVLVASRKPLSTVRTAVFVFG